MMTQKCYVVFAEMIRLEKLRILDMQKPLKEMLFPITTVEKAYLDGRFDEVNILENNMVGIFQHDNWKFDEEKFRKACEA